MFKIIQKFSSGITVESNFVLGGGGLISQGRLLGHYCSFKTIASLQIIGGGLKPPQSPPRCLRP
jgi:hypothetical protein